MDVYRVVQKNCLMHGHFATFCSQIVQFSRKCSERSLSTSRCKNLYQLVKYSLINSRNWTRYKRHHPACEHDTDDSWRSTAN